MIDFDTLKDAVPIIEVLDALGIVVYAEHRQAGQFRVTCSVCGNRTLSVSNDRNRWTCHKCKVSGDIIDLWARVKSVSTTAAAQQIVSMDSSGTVLNSSAQQNIFDIPNEYRGFGNERDDFVRMRFSGSTVERITRKAVGVRSPKRDGVVYFPKVFKHQRLVWFDWDDLEVLVVDDGQEVGSVKLPGWMKKAKIEEFTQLTEVE